MNFKNIRNAVKCHLIIAILINIVLLQSVNAKQNSSELVLGGKGFNWKATIQNDGRLEFKHLDKGNWKIIPFQKQGPLWYLVTGNTQQVVKMTGAGQQFTGILNEIQYSLKYSSSKEGLVLDAKITNKSQQVFSPQTAGIKLGLDTYMEKYPDWMSKFFPTMMRCEKTHFWGYAMSPEGDILTIGSPDSIASWSLDYQKGVFAHRINTLNLDLINQNPLPERHPQSLNKILPGETKKWRIVLAPARSLNDVKPLLSKICKAPMVDAERYTIEPGGETPIKIYSASKAEVKVISPDGTKADLMVKPSGKNLFLGNFVPTGSAGLYRLLITSGNNKTSEMMLTLRNQWSWYLKQARAEVISKPVRATPSIESIYGFHSLFLARKHFPDSVLDVQGEEKYKEVFPLVYDFKTELPIMLPERIQGPACMAGMLTDRYESTKDTNDLKHASALADYLLTKQHADGGYYSGRRHYTSVIYIAKSIMEVMVEEKKLADMGHKSWIERYERHLKSVKAAISDLNRRKINVETEGDDTFEDGMISCTATQLAMFAMLETDSVKKKEYTNAAIEVMTAHRCLTDLIIPDSRINGATKRFWEAWGSVRIMRNFMQSPHGWSAWRIYGLWYLYQLTGNEEWLRETMNALGSTTQLMDLNTGELHWAFMTDPSITTNIFVPDSLSIKGKYVNQTLGETYIKSLMGWYNGTKGRFISEGDCMTAQGYVADEEHEIFKALEECALTSAYIIERENGEIVGWNCKVQKTPNSESLVYPNEDIVDKVHINFKNKQVVKIMFANGKIKTESYKGMQWVYSK